MHVQTLKKLIINNLLFRCDPVGRVPDKITHSEDESLTDGTVSEDDDLLGMQDIAEDRIHDFKRTHFHSATQCNFCKKKVCIFYWSLLYVLHPGIIELSYDNQKNMWMGGGLDFF